MFCFSDFFRSRVEFSDSVQLPRYHYLRIYEMNFCGLVFIDFSKHLNFFIMWCLTKISFIVLPMLPCNWTNIFQNLLAPISSPSFTRDTIYSMPVLTFVSSGSSCLGLPSELFDAVCSWMHIGLTVVAYGSSCLGLPSELFNVSNLGKHGMYSTWESRACI